VLPKLIVLQGPVSGQVFPVPPEGLTFGRELDNSVSIPDVAVSRHHCTIRPVPGDAVEITDHGSRNGTFVNGLPIQVRALAHGDEIGVGRSRFLFLTSTPDDLSLGSIRLDGGAPDTRSLVLLRPEECQYLQPDAALRSAGPEPRAPEAWRILLKLAMVLRPAEGPPAVARDLLTLLFETLPAEAGAVWIEDESFACHRDPADRAEIEVSSPVIQRVRDTGVSALARRQGRAILAAPIVTCERTVGVLYLHSAQGGPGFDAAHLQLVTAAGVLCGPAIDHARRFDEMRNRNLTLELAGASQDLVGSTAPMRELFQRVARVAVSDATVLITGETGTGKELVARAIHRNSRRSQGPFVAVNCAAFAGGPLESELFGHERGAFTGAVALKKGRIELAAGGTLFLEEVAELPLGLQPKLLRVLQEREFDRLGSTCSLRADVRVIAAASRDLGAAVEAGDFREDLLHRLNVVPLRTPPLRERPEDIRHLARHFVAEFTRQFRADVEGISDAALQRLTVYDWPGNVRELRNAIERAVVLSPGGMILPEDLPESVLESAAGSPEPSRYIESVNAGKRQMILAALEQAGGSFAEAARALGLHPNSLHRTVRNLGIRDAVDRLRNQV
jgi:transcriptional regulator with GAF, ATPase, and Fis domain